MFGNFDGFYAVQEYDKIMNNASKNGHIPILEWFKNYGFTFKNVNWALFCASENGHITLCEARLSEASKLAIFCIKKINDLKIASLLASLRRASWRV